VDTKVVLVRHGETAWNRVGRIQGHTDSDLTSTGVRQAKAIGEMLGGQRFDHLVSSDLGRALRTAQLIAPKTGLEVRMEARFRERGFGIAEGKTYAEIDREFPEMFSRIRDTDPEYAAPGGESRRQFHERICSVMDEYANSFRGKSLLVVTHGGVLAAIYRRLSGLPIASPHKIDIPNAGYNCLRHDGHNWQIQVWGEVGHLPARTDSEGT
jgi:2,3-bisphosphoglycerate-dependent phosphoglycerate mutase